MINPNVRKMRSKKEKKKISLKNRLTMISPRNITTKTMMTLSKR